VAQSRIERLINLIAYLSDTRRSLTIREIIGAVPGYPEVFASARRTFERDKEDLRSMGFEVVVELNPSGDSGYRIDKEITYFDIDLDAQERNIIDYALEHFSPEEDLAKNSMSKIGGNNPENDLSCIRSLPLPKYLNSIFDAITSKRLITILYKGESRHLHAKKLLARSGFWYLLAIDVDKSAPRTYRLDRIDELEIGEQYVSDGSDVLIDKELNSESLTEIEVKVAKPLSTRFCETWSADFVQATNTYQLSIQNQKLFTNSLFDYSGFVAVIKPSDLSDEIDNIFSGVLDQLEGSA